MRARELRSLDSKLSSFLDGLFDGQVRARGREALGRYVEGLLLDGERKSIEPMAERLASRPEQVDPLRQSLRYTVAVSPWDDHTVLGKLSTQLVEQLPGLEVYRIDDTGFAKKGTHSVGVARQYSGTLGRVENCQVMVSLHLAGEQGSACIGWRLYLNEEWAADATRRADAGVPADVEFAPKWKLALAMLARARANELPAWPVCADAGYGTTTEFREGVRALSLHYAVGIESSLVFWPAGQTPQPPAPRKPGELGRPRTRAKSTTPPRSAKQLASTLSYRTVTWREGTRGPQVSRFASVRVQSAHEHTKGRAPGEEEWLLVEWPADTKEPTKYWLCSLPKSCSLRALVRLCKLRWRVERDDEDLKGELGLDHFEGRSWRGFHHHAALCAVAHAFLVLQRTRFPPEPNGAALDVASGSASAAAPAPPPHWPLPSLSSLG